MIHFEIQRLSYTVVIYNYVDHLVNVSTTNSIQSMCTTPIITNPQNKSSDDAIMDFLVKLNSKLD